LERSQSAIKRSVGAEAVVIMFLNYRWAFFN